MELSASDLWLSGILGMHAGLCWHAGILGCSLGSLLGCIRSGSVGSTSTAASLHLGLGSQASSWCTLGWGYSQASCPHVNILYVLCVGLK